MNYFLVLLSQHAEEETSSNPYHRRILMLERLLKTITGEFAGVVKVKNDDGKTVIRYKDTGGFVTRLRRGYVWQNMNYLMTQSAFIITTTANDKIVIDATMLALPCVRGIILDATKYTFDYNSSDDCPIDDDLYA